MSFLKSLEHLVSRRFLLAGGGLVVIYHDPSSAIYVAMIVIAIAGSNAGEKVLFEYFQSPNKPTVPLISFNPKPQQPTQPTIPPKDLD